MCYLIKSNILYSEQIAFRNGYSTEHDLIQLVDQMIDSFVFIDLPKLLTLCATPFFFKKLELYAIMDRNY